MHRADRCDSLSRYSSEAAMTSVSAAAVRSGLFGEAGR